MKKIVLSFTIIGLLGLSSCTPNRFFLINSEGILTYNRHTGQLEFMWQTKSAGGDSVSVVKCDSLLDRSR
jgi:hypothetical protein